MTLDPVSLSDDLRLLFESLPTSASEAADGMAQTYYDYASGGAFAGAPPAIPGANKTALAATLLAAISVPAVGLPATIAAAWAAGLTAFWVAVPVPGGVTNGCPGAASTVAGLTAVFANLANTADTAALGIAAALDVATRTVTATIAGVPVPIA